MLKEREIRDQLAGYLARQISLHDFSSWLHSVTWDMEAATDLRTQALVYEVLGRLGEHSSVGSSEDVLRADLEEFARIIIDPGPLPVPVALNSSVVSLVSEPLLFAP
jgi:hypothetical protein